MSLKHSSCSNKKKIVKRTQVCATMIGSEFRLRIEFDVLSKGHLASLGS